MVDNSSAVRSDRNASVNCDFGCASTLILRCAVVSVLISSDERRARGTTASDGSSVMLSISATLRSPVSRLSIRKAMMTPPSRLNTSVERIIVDCGFKAVPPAVKPGRQRQSPKTPIPLERPQSEAVAAAPRKASGSIRTPAAEACIPPHRRSVCRRPSSVPPAPPLSALHSCARQYSSALPAAASVSVLYRSPWIVRRSGPSAPWPEDGSVPWSIPSAHNSLYRSQSVPAANSTRQAQSRESFR